MRFLLLLPTLLTALLTHAMPKLVDDFTLKDEDAFEKIFESEVAPLQENSPQQQEKGRIEDRNVGGGARKCASDHVFICAGGKEVCEVQRCDGVMDCPMGDDEEDCDCMAGQFLCDDVRCLPGELWCDGVFDCQDGTDEAKCGGDGGGCNGDHSFICASGNEICDVQVCDGVVDCPTMDDETGCYWGS